MKKNKFAFIQFTYCLIIVICWSIAQTAVGQTSTTSVFERKVDNYLNLFLPNFDVVTEISKGAGQILDRAGPTWKKKVVLTSKATIQDKNGNTTSLNLRLAFYEFDDNVKCKAAMDSLLNCFGGGCSKINWGAADQSAKTTPCIYIFNANEIISCHVSCEQKNNYWTFFTSDLEKTFSSSGTKVLEADCGGPIIFREK